MFRTVGPSGSLFELLLPAGMRVLSGELAQIDELLDDPRFFGPFRGFFDPTEGRPSIPMETYLRLLFLKVRFELGYEQLCVQVNDSLSWRRFCRIGLEARVPDESTIRKLTRRLGPGVVDELNVVLLGLAAESGHLSLDRVRVDTTVVEADIKYPTDSGLLTKAVSRIAVLMRRIDTAGMTVVYTDRTLAARHHQHQIGVWLRRRSDEAKPKSLVSLACWPISRSSASPSTTRSASRNAVRNGRHADASTNSLCWPSGPAASSPKPAHASMAVSLQAQRDSSRSTNLTLDR